MRAWATLLLSVAMAEAAYPVDVRSADGHVLLGELNCTACHAATEKQSAWLFPKRAPSLADIGSRASAQWLQHYLASPHETMPGTTMPDVLHGNAEQAKSLTHYLLSLAPVKIRRVMHDSAAVARGEGLYHRIGCVACHAPQNSTTKLSSSVPLPRMAEKWSFDGLRRFLREPLATRPSGRMPGMNLTESEAAAIAHYLLREAPAQDRDRVDSLEELDSVVVDSAKVAEGRALYAELNCAACHEAKAPASPPPPALTALQAGRGCLAEKPAGAAPDFHLDAAWRSALQQALASLNRADLLAPSAEQRVTHTLASLHCTACHVRDGVGGAAPERDVFFTSNGDDLGDEGRLPPRLDGVGDRLRPAWLSNVLASGASVRPYFDTRMPQFGAANVRHLTELLVALDRRPQSRTPVPDAPEVQRNAGRQLAGTDGLACIACHRFNRQPAHALQAIDLATTAERLNEDWFRQFLRDPNRFHPGTRMPAFWPDGASPLPALLDGSTDRQHAALWTYLADGASAKFPEGLSRQNVELIVGGEPVVYRGKMWEAGFRAVAMGYPGQLNAAFDAEEMRLALLWRGRFLNAGPHWGVQGMGSIRPLGTDVVVLPHGAALAVLTDASAPWPSNAPKELGWKFGGYQLDSLKRPTLLYSFRKAGVEDFLTPIDANGTNGLRRLLKFTNPPPNGLHLRLAVGRLTVSGDAAWRLNDALTLRVLGGAKAFVRGEADRQELLVALSAPSGKNQLEVVYVW